ncbi:MAG: cytochrome c oxidase cbb3-type subunit 3 [Vicingaceae bacterium]|jgi:cytochrome c oxidase cbb3-type subunit 3
MKRYNLLIASFLCLPMMTFAGNSIAKASGISDAILLTILVSFIVLLLVITKVLVSSIEAIGRESKNTETNNSTTTKVLSLLFLSSIGLSAQAAETTASLEPAYVLSDMLFWILIGAIVVLAIIIGVLFKSLNTLIKVAKGESFEEAEETSDLFASLNLTDNIPIEREVDIMLDHDYDGIKELDNNLPPWWKYMFYATIVFAVVYLIRYHVTGDGQLQTAEYLTEMKEAAAEKETMMANATDLITEENVTYLIAAADLAKGEAIYQGNCATCHGQLGEGGTGPNMTDEYWIHGGGIKNIFKTIKYGVPAKGMIAWQSQFSPSQMQKVASYVLSLQETNPANGKAPQGEKYVEEVVEDVAPADSTATDVVAATVAE